MTNFLNIIHRLFLIKTHDVSETGVCLSGPAEWVSFYVMTETYYSLRNVVCVLYQKIDDG
jgi:hypothetical protein